LGQLDGGSKPWSSPKLPSCRHGSPGTTEEGGAEEAKKKGLKHIFASYARPSASHPFVILSNWVLDINLQEAFVM
jgi:hypothetical protein